MHLGAWWQDMPVNSAISAPASKSLVQLTPEGCVEMKASKAITNRS